MKVNIQQLKDGKFECTDQIDFSKVEISNDEVTFLGALSVTVQGDKFHHNYKLDVAFNSVVEFPCDRCLAPFTVEISDEFSVIYTKHYQENYDGEENIIEIPKDAIEIDISEELLEAVVLSFPMKRLHVADCKGICSGCGINLNREDCQCDVQVDPRWEALKNIKFNDRED